MFWIKEIRLFVVVIRCGIVKHVKAFKGGGLDRIGLILVLLIFRHLVLTLKQDLLTLRRGNLGLRRLTFLGTKIGTMFCFVIVR